MLKKWKRLNSKIVHKNPWWTYKLDEFEIPGGVRGEYHHVFTRGSSMIIPRLDDGRILLVKQYRYLCDRESIEFPCGSVKSGSDYLQTAHAELQEESGFCAGKMAQIGEFNPFNGVTGEICRVFLASGLEKAISTPDATEEFELLRCTPAEIDILIRDGIIWDGMTLAAWLLARGCING